MNCIFYSFHLIKIKYYNYRVFLNYNTQMYYDDRENYNKHFQKNNVKRKD